MTDEWTLSSYFKRLLIERYEDGTWHECEVLEMANKNKNITFEDLKDLKEYIQKSKEE